MKEVREGISPFSHSRRAGTITPAASVSTTWASLWGRKAQGSICGPSRRAEGGRQEGESGGRLITSKRL